MHRPSHFSQFYHPNSIGWVQIINLLIMHTHHRLMRTVNYIVEWNVVSWNYGLLYQSLMTDDYRAVVEWHVARETKVLCPIVTLSVQNEHGHSSEGTQDLIIRSCCLTAQATAQTQNDAETWTYETYRQW
jgi:hypothetical protein